MSGWVIIGQELADKPGVVVFASDELNEARLREMASMRSGQTLTMTLEMQPGSYIKITGDTFEQALSALFSFWRPSRVPTAMLTGE